MKRVKSFFALIMSLAMILTSVQIPTYAALKADAGKASVELIPLKTDGTSISKLKFDNFSESSISDLNLKVGDTFYVGVKLKDFKNIVESDNGLARFDIAFKFNKDVLQLITQQNTTTKLQKVTSQFLTQTATYQDGEGEDVENDYVLAYTYDAAEDTFLTYTSDASISSSDNSSTSTTDDTIYFSVESEGQNENPQIKGGFEGKNDAYVGIVGFKLVGADDGVGNKVLPANGTELFSYSTDSMHYTCSFGITTASVNNYLNYQKSDDGAATDINTVIDFKTDAVDFFPADAETLTSIAVAGTPTLSYIEGDNFDPTVAEGTSLSVTPTTSKGVQAAITPTKTDYKGLKFYYADSDSLGDDMSTATEITTDTKFTVNNNGKYLYVAYKLGNVTKAAKLGQLKVVAKSLSSIAVKEGSTFATGTYYNTTKVLDAFAATTNPETLTVTLTYNNGDTQDLAYGAFGENYALCTVNADGKFEKVIATTTYTVGAAASNKFYVVPAASVGQTAVDVTIKAEISNTNAVSKDYWKITGVGTSNNPKTVYNTGDKFSSAKIAVSGKNASGINENTNVTTFDDNYKFVVAKNETDAKGITAPTLTDGETVMTDYLDGTYSIWVVYTDPNTNDMSVVKVAALTNATIDTSEAAIAKNIVANLGLENITYGTKLSDLTTTKTEDGQVASEMVVSVYYTDSTTIPHKLKYNDLSGAGITIRVAGLKDGENDVTVNADTVILPAWNGKTLEFVYTNPTTNAKTVVATSGTISVTPKALHYTVAKKTGVTDIKKTYNGNADVQDSDGNAQLEVKFYDLDNEKVLSTDTTNALTATIAYNNKNVASGKAISVTNVESTDLDTNKYTLTAIDNMPTFTGEIEAKTLTITADNLTIDSIQEGAEPTNKNGEAALATANGVIGTEQVKVKYTYKYRSSTEANPTVDITLTGLTGTDAGNYALPETKALTKTGSIQTKTLKGIKVVPAKDADGKDIPFGPYEYPNNKFDKKNLEGKVYLVYEGADGKDEVDDTPIVLDDLTVTAPTGVDLDKLPYTATEITITSNGKSTKLSVSGKKKQIKLSDINFVPDSKLYDGTTTATGTATVKDGVTVANDTVTISAKWEFDGKDVGTNTIKVSDIKADNDNYEIVGENKITINNSTAVIKPATPKNVTAKADKKTNNIVLSGTTADFEYSTDNGATWVKAAAGTTTIENAVRNKEYTILVRTAATTSAPAASDAVTVKATSYKYLVNIYKNGAAAGSEPEYKVYTNDEEINAVKDDTTFGKFNSNVLQYTPSRFSAYFTDSACTTSADVAHLPNDSNDNINLYYTAKKSSGGGGGGGSSVSIKLDKDTVSGVVGDKIKVTATVKGSTAKPTWTSSNKDVATVDENGNITLIGKGTATVKVKVNGIVKNIPVTVKEATATPTPVPTVKPTEAPVINTEYTKPYASGYDDGSFLPNNNITRGELAAMIARLSYGDDLPDGMYQASFPDVDSDAWFNKYIGYLEDKDVLSGYEDGTFRPMDTITRGEISAVIARAQRYDLISYNGIFTDVTENDWAKDYIETLADKNIVSGYEDGTFGPYSPLTRAEAVAIINRVLVESTPIVTFTPNDIAGHWAEADILLAVNERMVGANAVVPTVKPEETAAPEETVAPETTVTPEETVAPEKTTAPAA